MKRPGGFTLVELLVVIVIIGLLIALLFAAGRVVWETALMVQCQSNMHQICIAIVHFATEHDGRLPGGEYDKPKYEWVGSSSYLRPSGGEDRDAVLWRCPQKGSLFPYVKSEGVYLCPKDRSCSVEETKERGGPPPWERGSGLGNGRFSYTTPSLLNGASLDLLSDCHCEYTDFKGNICRMMVPILFEEDSDWCVGHSWHDRPRGYPDGSWGSWDALSDRHFDACNIGYIDGRVERFDWQQVSPWLEARDLDLRTPKGKISFDNAQGFTWEYRLDDWYGEQ